ncbi:MAG: hypothetical protein ACE5D6_07190 [Candidatus Zixiibacteriota bacterium]
MEDFDTALVRSRLKSRKKEKKDRLKKAFAPLTKSFTPKSISGFRSTETFKNPFKEGMGNPFISKARNPFISKNGKR